MIDEVLFVLRVLHFFAASLLLGSCLLFLAAGTRRSSAAHRSVNSSDSQQLLQPTFGGEKGDANMSSIIKKSRKRISTLAGITALVLLGTGSASAALQNQFNYCYSTTCLLYDWVFVIKLTVSAVALLFGLFILVSGETFCCVRNNPKIVVSIFFVLCAVSSTMGLLLQDVQVASNKTSTLLN
mmetsp:Transcript_48447/g.125693  ORF Transcript_48447/g.125693 Transcript_48447/m.125693 type:complete len:183 (-) Transcript_48447:16-564(-)